MQYSKYKIINEVSNHQYYKVFLATDMEAASSSTVYLYEFFDPEITSCLKKDIEDGRLTKVLHLRESFYHDLHLCLVLTDTQKGEDFKKYFSNDTTRLADRLRIAERLLTKITEMQDLSPMLLCGLLSSENIFVLYNKSILIGNKLQINKSSTSMQEIALLLKMIFDGSGTQKSNTAPPAIYEIITGCNQGNYTTPGDVLKTLQSTLLYQTLFGNVSIDSELDHAFTKVKTKHKMRFFPLFLAAFCFASGIFIYSKTHQVSLPNKPVSGILPVNQLPIANFQANTNKFYTEDLVTFVDTSTDADVLDKIVKWQWTLLDQQGNKIANFYEPEFHYVFTKPMDYILKLLVWDSNEICSEEKILMIKVTEKPSLPDSIDPQIPDKNPK